MVDDEFWQTKRALFLEKKMGELEHISLPESIWKGKSWGGCLCMQMESILFLIREAKETQKILEVPWL